MPTYEYYTDEDRATILALLTNLAQGVNPDFSAVYADVHRLWCILRSERSVVEMQPRLSDMLGWLWGEMKGRRGEEWLTTFNECNQFVSERWRR